MQNQHLLGFPVSRDLAAPLKCWAGGSGLSLVQNWAEGLPLHPSNTFLRLLYSLACFIFSFPPKSHSLHYRCLSGRVRSLRLVCILPHRSFLPEAFRWAVPPPALPRLADRSLTPLGNVLHPLFPPVFSCFGRVLSPQLSHSFSHLCLQDSFLSSKRRIKEFSEMKFVLARSPCLQPELGTQLRSANTC